MRTARVSGFWLGRGLRARVLVEAAPVDGLPARFLWVVWNSALPSAIAGLAVMMPQTTSDSSCAMELPYIAGIRVKASRSSLISVWRVIATTRP